MRDRCGEAAVSATTRICLLLALASLAAPGIHAADGTASLYQMHEKLTNQDGKAIDLDVYRGHKVLVTMFYGSCPATCPLIIDTLRALERKARTEQGADLRVLLISFDAEHDTPAALRELATSRRIDTARWTLARADVAAVRRIAAALTIQYKPLPGGQFSHSTIISLLDGDGAILVRSSELGHADPVVLGALGAR
jgi:protein SCO1/2